MFLLDPPDDGIDRLVLARALGCLLHNESGCGQAPARDAHIGVLNCAVDAEEANIHVQWGISSVLPGNGTAP